MNIKLQRMAAVMNKDLKHFLNGLIRIGYTVEHGSKTYKIRSPKGGLVCCSRTPSCRFAIRHIKADLKRLAMKEGGLERLAP